MYALSLALFLYHLLTALGLISLSQLIPAHIWLDAELLLGLAFAPLLLAAVFFAVRDSYRRMFERPL